MWYFVWFESCIQTVFGLIWVSVCWVAFLSLWVGGVCVRACVQSHHNKHPQENTWLKIILKHFHKTEAVLFECYKVNSHKDSPLYLSGMSRLWSSLFLFKRGHTLTVIVSLKVATSPPPKLFPVRLRLHAGAIWNMHNFLCCYTVTGVDKASLAHRAVCF